MNRLILLCLLALSTTVVFAVPPQPLPPEQVYQMTPPVAQNGHIQLHWTILPGYYLYKQRFHFISHTSKIQLGTPDFPAGKSHHDKYFGDVTIYRNNVNLAVPYSGHAASLKLEVVYQGCADIGFCYSPQHRTFTLVLPASEQLARVKPLDLASLADGSHKPEFLPVDKAFAYSAQPAGTGQVQAHWAIAKGYYLYKDKFHFRAEGNPGISLGQARLPPGQNKQDKYFGTTTVYHRAVDITIPYKGHGAFTLTATFQGCATAGICYPPTTRSVRIDPGAVANYAKSSSPFTTGSEQDRLGHIVRSAAIPVVMLIFFAAGLLLTFTPCVLPMVPIISSLIVGQGIKVSTGRAFVISLIYVLGMALTYTAAGVIVALLGANLQIWFQNPWVIGAFSLIFVALALSMFGVYELQMPAAIQSKLTRVSNSQQAGSYFGAGIMGVLSALIVGPCITAPLVAALLAIGQSGEPLRGGLALFSMSMGMGVPLLIIGVSAGKLLPKAGAWMTTVKSIFGFLLLGLALWFLSRIVPAWVNMLGWSLLFLASGVYFLTLEVSTHGWRTGVRTAGLILTAWGLAVLIGLAIGRRDPLRPLAGIGLQSVRQIASGPVSGGDTGNQAHGLAFKRIKGLSGLQTALAQATATGHPAMLDFYADWCVSCKEMENEAFQDPTVKKMLGNTVLLQADVTANDSQDQALLKRFGIFGPPSVLFFNIHGREMTALRLVGYQNTDQFRTHIEAVLAQVKKD